MVQKSRADPCGAGAPQVAILLRPRHVVDTNFRVNETDAGDEWYYEDTPGHWKRIPPDVIHWGVSAPGGLPTLFVFGTQETCFYPGTGGI